MSDAINVFNSELEKMADDILVCINSDIDIARSTIEELFGFTIGALRQDIPDIDKETIKEYFSQNTQLANNTKAMEFINNYVDKEFEKKISLSTDEFLDSASAFIVKTTRSIVPAYDKIQLFYYITDIYSNSKPKSQYWFFDNIELIKYHINLSFQEAASG